jgi:hypothetical protein
LRLRFPPPSSNRTCRFPASGFHVNSRHRVVHGCSDSLNLVAQPASQEKTIPQLDSRGFRRGDLRPSGIPSLLLKRVYVQAPWLPGHYPLPRYYGPVRLPTEPLPRLCFPSERWRRLRRHPAGSPRFLDRSVSTRRPLSPRQAQRLLAPIASSLAAGFITLRRTGRLQV